MMLRLWSRLAALLACLCTAARTGALDRKGAIKNRRPE